MNDRIRLAEAMGLDFKAHGDDVYLRNDVGRPMSPFDPFTDANDDYAVLEWMRNMGRCELQARFIKEIVNVAGLSGWWVYEIGDYARAALKVIDDD